VIICYDLEYSENDLQVQKKNRFSAAGLIPDENHKK